MKLLYPVIIVNLFTVSSEFIKKNRHHCQYEGTASCSHCDPNNLLYGTSRVTTTYNPRSVEGAGDKVCPSSQAELRDSIHQDVVSLINSIILPELAPHLQRPCGCGGPGWRRIAYLDMSDTTQTSCPGDWELITTPKKSCGRPANATGRTCYSAFFQSLSYYSQVCGRIIGYQVGEPQAFVLENVGDPQTIDGPYVDGVSLTYGNPRQHIWTFAVPLQENYFDR